MKASNKTGRFDRASNALNEIERTIADWAALEMAPWQDVDLPPGGIEPQLRATVAEHNRTCLLRIDNGVVTLDPELAAERPFFSDPLDHLGVRVADYLKLLNQAASTFGVTGSGLMALFVDDIFPGAINTPVFCFQKRSGMRSLLLPDVDFVSWNFYSKPDDELFERRIFDEKDDAAIFVGSTTGDVVLTAPHVTELRNKRLRAAVRFRESERIRFHLPHIVQCDNPETVQLVQALNVAGRTWTWQEQLGFRYLLSMDGNGATCSRVVLALQSNSVLFKYNSPYQLYYFRGLQPWRHYVPIVEDEDIEDLLADSARLVPVFRRIIGDATHFAATYLSRLSVLRYTAELLSPYLMAFGQGAAPLAAEDNRLLIDLEAHVADIGFVWRQPGAWLADTARPNAIEGFRLIANGILPLESLSYSAFDQGGVESAPVSSGRFCGTRASGLPLYGLRISLSPEAEQAYRLRYRARFADGYETRAVGSGVALQRDTPLTDVRIEIEPRRHWI